MAEYSKEEIRRTLHALRVTTQVELHRLVDEDATPEQVMGFSGIEDVRAPIVVYLRSLSADEWYKATGLLPYVGYVPTGEGEGVVQTDQV